MCSSQSIYLRALRPRAVARSCRPTRSACSTTRARTPTATAATARPRTRPRSSRRKSASPCAAAQPRGRARLGQLRPRAALRHASGASMRNGKLVALDYQAWSHATAWLETASQLALGHAAADRRLRRWPGSAAGRLRHGPGGAGLFSVHLSQTDMYDVPNRRIVNHRRRRAPAICAPVRCARRWTRRTFFALEGMLDELAHAARLDPYELRKRNISHPRWLGVLEGRGRRGEVDAARRGVAACRARESSRAAASASARTICRRTRAIASPTRPRSSTSR